jgi:hypothetical protein
MQTTFARYVTAVLALGLAYSLGCSPAHLDDSETAAAELGERASDPTGMGPHAVADGEYRLPASVDPDILGDRETEIWAHVYRPATLNTAEKHPLLVFLHGNHGTCGRGTNPRVDDNVQYTMLGTCPPGYVVTPNHLGYAYVAERLASWGYIVVSINANRGITAGRGTPEDFGLNLARGRLVLKHLQLLSEWNEEPGKTPASVGADLAGAIDFSNVGFMGHSRGGEGVRAAYVQYNDQGSPWPARIKAPLEVKAIFEIGPVDGQTSRTLDALNTAWNVILPMCDGDVYNLQGMRPFDRMLASSADESRPTPKGMFAVWGANHNFYNTEWQTSDSRGCQGTGHLPLFERTAIGSAKQQSTGLHALMGFFRAHVGKNANPELDRSYDPLYRIPESLEAITPIERAYADAARGDNVRVLEDFTKPAGTSLSGAPTIAEGVTVTHGSVPEHDPALKAASIKWTGSGAEKYFEIPFAAPGASVDASAMKTLDFRVSRQGSADSSGPMSFSIQLVGADGSLSQPVKLSDYLDLPTFGGHVVLATARIPLADFANAQLASVRGVRFVFDDTADGALYLSSIRFSRSARVAPVSNVTPGRFVNIDEPGTSHQTVRITTGNNVAAVRGAPSREVEIELESTFAFPVSNDLPRLRIGSRDVLLSGYTSEGDTHRLVFTIRRDELAAIPDNAPMKVRYGEDVATYEWDFGNFKKAQIQR